MRYIIIILVAICVFAACSEDKFTTYDSTRYLYFAKGITADSITESFFFYPDETIQHAGVITGLGGYAGHSHKYKKAGGSGYLFLMLLAAMLALACFNIWRKVRRKTRNMY